MTLQGMQGPGRLRTYCQENGFTYGDIAGFMGLSEQTVTQWGSSATRPRLAYRYGLETLTKGFVTPDMWLTGAELDWFGTFQAKVRATRKGKPFQVRELSPEERLQGRI